MEFSSEQNQLINDPHPALLVGAPAGAGKTRVLIGKASRLIESGVPSDRICILTFTKKSAQDIRIRLREQLSVNAQSVICGTFHGFALDCLRAYDGILGLSTDFEVLSPTHAVKILRQSIHKITPDFELSTGDVAKLYQEISASINLNQDIEERRKRLPFAVSLETLNRWLDQFVEDKLRSKLFDYDDLLLMFTLALESDQSYGKRLSERFLYVLVDEYQDVNDLQARMIELLTAVHQRIFAIGDHAQAIYGFRGANVGHFRAFTRQYLHGQVRSLSVNYRSTPSIVELAENLLKQDLNFSERRVVAHRTSKKPIVLVGTPTQHAEANYIAREIKLLIENGCHPSEIAILVRLKHQAASLEMALLARGISVNVRVNRSVLNEQHVKETLCLLKIVDQPSDLDAWQYLFSQVRGVGPVLSQRASRYAAGFDDSGKFGPAQAEIVQMLNRIREGVALINRDRTQVSEAWLNLYPRQSDPAVREKVKDVDALAHLWRDKGTTLRLMDELNFSGRLDEVCHLPESGVNILSIHQSKGLEWHTVFVPGVNEGTLPIFGSADRIDGLEEERRLLYVAMTRASDLLYLCCQADSKGSMSLLGSSRSRFLDFLVRDRSDLFQGVWYSGERA